jgi:diguanylate cyclase (GGDEF)-like protein
MTVQMAWATAVLVLAVVTLRQWKIIRNLKWDVERTARIDPLTKLLNRLALDHALEREIERSGRSGKYPSLIFMDVDGFREINDQQGRSMGDEVLGRVATAIRAAIRFEIDLASRYGNDEFVVMFPETSSAQALKVAERVQETLKAQQVTLAVGVVECQPGWSSEVFFHQVGQEMSKRRK